MVIKEARLLEAQMYIATTPLDPSPAQPQPTDHLHVISMWRNWRVPTRWKRTATALSIAPHDDHRCRQLRPSVAMQDLEPRHMTQIHPTGVAV